MTEAERVAKEQQARQEWVAKMKAAHVAEEQRIRKEREEETKRKQARQEIIASPGGGLSEKDGSQDTRAKGDYWWAV
jgi:phage FluMu gp28-like protein